LVDPKNGKILYQQRLPWQAAFHMLDKAYGADLDYLLYSDPLSDLPMVSRLTPLLADFILLEGLHRVELNTFEQIIRHDPPVKVQIVGYDEARLLAFQRFVEAQIPEIAIVSTQNDYLEAMPAGVSKGYALTRLGKRLHVPLSQIVAFGDSVNDKELLAVAGIGVAMADAAEELKMVADRIVENVAAGLKDLLG
jgi:hydroxymethylpyrimidine pyrophosphatase-like HAD family hydrolase